MKIKEIATSRYEISLFETEQGFQIMYSSGLETQTSEFIKDYYTVDYLFNLKYMELEGQ